MRSAVKNNLTQSLNDTTALRLRVRPQRHRKFDCAFGAKNEHERLGVIVALCETLSCGRGEMR